MWGRRFVLVVKKKKKVLLPQVEFLTKKSYILILKSQAFFFFFFFNTACQVLAADWAEVWSLVFNEMGGLFFAVSRNFARCMGSSEFFTMIIKVTESESDSGQGLLA